MSNGTVVRMHVRPSKRSHLAFDVEGVLEELHVELGQEVHAFHFHSFYGGLGATVAGAPAELEFDSAAIGSAVAGKALGSLRAEARKAALDSASRREPTRVRQYGRRGRDRRAHERVLRRRAPRLEAEAARGAGRDLAGAGDAAAQRLRGRQPPGGGQVDHQRTRVEHDEPR